MDAETLRLAAVAGSTACWRIAAAARRAPAIGANSDEFQRAGEEADDRQWDLLDIGRGWTEHLDDHAIQQIDGAAAWLQQIAGRISGIAGTEGWLR